MGLDVVVVVGLVGCDVKLFVVTVGSRSVPGLVPVCCMGAAFDVLARLALESVFVRVGFIVCTEVLVGR